MSRPIFGVTPSPSEVRRVQGNTRGGYCSRLDIPASAPLTADVCAACRLRDPCGVRKDDRAAGAKALVAALNAESDACRSGEKDCSDFPYCGHRGHPADMLAEFFE